MTNDSLYQTYYHVPQSTNLQKITPKVRKRATYYRERERSGEEKNVRRKKRSGGKKK